MKINLLMGLIFLLWESAEDIKSRQLNIITLIIFAFLGLIINFFIMDNKVGEICLSLLPGIVMILLSFISNQSVGYGDGVVVGIIGLYVGLARVVVTGIFALIIAMFFSMVLVTVGNVGHRQTIPFVPFILISYVGGLML